MLLAGELHDVDSGGIQAVVYREKRSDEKASPCSASRFRSGSLRSPPLHREAEQLLQSVTYAVRRFRVSPYHLFEGQKSSLTSTRR